MNLSRGWLLAGKPPGLAPAWVCLALLLTGLHFAVAITDGSRATPALEADFLPGGSQRAAADLQLHGEAAAKADALAAFSQAIIAEDNADSDAALDDYKKALALDPGYTELAVKVAYELARRGDPSAGIQVLKDSIKASPKAPLSYLYLSQLYAKFLKKPEVGLKYAQQALDLDPTNFPSYLAVYDIWETLDQPRKALAVLDRATRLEHADVQFWLQLGEFYLKALGDGPIPPEELAKLTVIYEKALALGREDPQTLAHVADFFARTEQEKAAIPLYLDAIKYSPANPPEGDQTLAGVRDSLARCFIADGRTGDAIATLKQLIKDNPLRYESYELLFDLYYEKSNDAAAALAVAQQMTLLDQSDYRNCLRIAESLMKEEKIDTAIQTLNEGRVKFPTEAQITCSLGIALSAAKRYHEALDIFSQAVEEANHGETEMLDGQFYFAYGTAAEQAGDIDKAAELLEKSIALNPNSAEAYNYLGYAWVDRGLKLDEGAGLIRKALDMDPNNAAYIDSLGWYYFKKGDFKDAVVTLKKAAGLINPEDATVDEHVGDAYAASNDTAHALEYWQKAAALDKDNKEVAVKIAGAREKLAHQGSPAHSTP